MAKKKTSTLPNSLPAVYAHETVSALVRLPEETAGALDEAIQLQAETLSPFDEDDTTAAWEVIGTHDGTLFVWVAVASNTALSEAWHETLQNRGLLASVRLDATPLCWLRALPEAEPALKTGQALVLLRTACETLLVLFTQGNAVALRGLAPTSTPADITREAMRLLAQAALDHLLDDSPLKGICFTTEAGTVAALTDLTTEPPQEVVLTEEAAMVMLQKALHQRAESDRTFDLTPQIWRDEAKATRTRRALIVMGVLFGILWSLAALTLFLLPKYYAQRAKEAALRIQAHRSAYNDVVDLQERVGLIMRYQDRRFSALEMMRLICAAKASDMTFLSVTYRQKQSLRLTGLCGDTSGVYAFKETVQKDERIKEVRINRLAQDTKTRQQRFDIDIIFVIESEDEQ
ncbi:MAG: hypothetical protein J6V91_06485 [Kiritimatiellae bacterium]|nr:hypothetical protein [Kiritimatiellia bacterium]